MIVGPWTHLCQRFEFGPRTSSVHIFYLFYRVFESFCVSYSFRVNFHFISNCYLCLNVVNYRFVLNFVRDKYRLVLKFIRINHYLVLNVLFFIFLVNCVSY